MKIFVLIRNTCLLLLIVSWLAACTEEKLTHEGTGIIKGKVLDEHDSSPLINAEVSTNPPSQMVLTDSTGQFVLEDVLVGDYNVIAKHKDYFSATTALRVNLRSSSHVILNLTGRTSEIDLPEFTNDYFPEHAQENVPVNFTFSWKIRNPKDTVDFEIRLFEPGQATPVFEHSTADTFAMVSGLKFNTVYLWQLSAENAKGKVFSDIKSFSTRSFPDNYFLFAKRVDQVSQIFVSENFEDEGIQITHHSFHSWKPIANAQKERIAFLSTRDIHPQLFVMRADGSEVNKLTNIPTGGYYNKGVGFSWLPDGERIVFSSYNKLFVIQVNGTQLQEIVSIDSQRHFREVDWSPQNDKIVALTLGVDRYDAEIILMNTNGSNAQVIVGGKEGALENPTFSIDGKKILYSYDVSGFQSVSGRQLDARIFQYNIQTGETRDMSVHKPNGTNDLMPRYTEDGASILFVHSSNVSNARRDLWKMRSDSLTNQGRIELIRNIEAPDW